VYTMDNSAPRAFSCIEFPELLQKEELGRVSISKRDRVGGSKCARTLPTTGSVGEVNDEF
jgi:hypothetical protein